jgi:hypothetical protein
MKSLLLLASIYPLFLLLVISFTYVYTMHKPEVTEFAQIKTADLFKVNFLSPAPTTIVLQADTLETVIASEPAHTKTQQTEALPTPASPSAELKTSTSSATESDETTDRIPDAKQIIQTVKAQITPLPTISKESLEEARSKSVVIMENDISSSIIDSASSLIIEND